MNCFHSHNNHYHPEEVHDEIHIANHEHCKHHDFKKMKGENSQKLKLVMIATMIFAVIELIGGIMTGSLALLSDFFHMLTDSASLLLALSMAFLSQKPANESFSFGHGRSETIGALVNGIFMIGIIGYLIFEAIHRLFHPENVNALGIIWIAVGGLLVNVFAIYMLKDSHSLNTKAALLHVIGDLFGSIAAVVAGVVIYFTGYMIFDPLLSLLVSAILIHPTYTLLKNSTRILMEGVPEHLDYIKVGDAINSIKGVVSTHDLHIWSMGTSHTALSAHVAIEKVEDWHEVLKEIQSMLANQFDILHVTLQPEIKSYQPEISVQCFNKKK